LKQNCQLVPKTQVTTTVRNQSKFLTPLNNKKVFNNVPKRQIVSPYRFSDRQPTKDKATQRYYYQQPAQLPISVTTRNHHPNQHSHPPPPTTLPDNIIIIVIHHPTKSISAIQPTDPSHYPAQIRRSTQQTV
jgi:hypothetical protein